MACGSDPEVPPNDNHAVQLGGLQQGGEELAAPSGRVTKETEVLALHKAPLVLTARTPAVRPSVTCGGALPAPARGRGVAAAGAPGPAGRLGAVAGRDPAGDVP